MSGQTELATYEIQGRISGKIGQTVYVSGGPIFYFDSIGDAEDLARNRRSLDNNLNGIYLVVEFHSILGVVPGINSESRLRLC